MSLNHLLVYWIYILNELNVNKQIRFPLLQSYPQSAEEPDTVPQEAFTKEQSASSASFNMSIDQPSTSAMSTRPSSSSSCMHIYFIVTNTCIKFQNKELYRLVSQIAP